MRNEIELLAFYSSLESLYVLEDAGIDGVIIDWETKGKDHRQHFFNTQITKHSLADLKLISKFTSAKITCRVNGQAFLNKREILDAIEGGADEVLIPMVKTLEEVDFVFQVVREKAKVALMLETEEALLLADQLDKYPVSKFFVGLNDLSIQRNSRNIFKPISDGTITELRPKITKPFGMAGLTHPMEGNPVPCHRLIKEMVRFNCTFAFLRRSFYRDLEKYNAKEILKAIRLQFEKETNSIYLNEATSEEKKILNKALI
ncbi:hypothetical protein [Flexithrix dorotheae]|uniref:hypothetical protein n=1 Tax=Flexithrix dorotheae TaxID=70993 RepID=UPI00035DDDF8|nr:hypothetical protein [Flexithrix dorotheae]